MLSVVLIALLSVFSVSAVAADAPANFRQAKKVAAKIYQLNPQTFYCDCAFKDNQVDAQSCGYSARKNAKRGQRIEWEHVVSAWEFGHQRQCWQQGGRKHCEKNDALFNKMESDLHNLVPAVGELNGDRSNFRFGMIEGEPRAYGACDFEVDFKGRRAEPKADRQGDIARIYFYMRDTYGLKISRQQEQLFNAWHKMDPVDAWEIKRDELIEKAQGNRNCYVRACKTVTPKK